MIHVESVAAIQEKLARLNQLMSLIRVHQHNRNAFDILYEKLEEEYYRNEGKRHDEYTYDLDCTISKYAKRYIHRSIEKNYRLFIFSFKTNIEKEINRLAN